MTSIDVDTMHFLGNFPASFELHGCYSETQDEAPDGHDKVNAGNWVTVVHQSKLGPGQIFSFELSSEAKGRVFSHVRLTIYPDGGIKRLRVFGRRAQSLKAADIDVSDPKTLVALPPPTKSTVSNNRPVLDTATPLTSQTFAAYGHVICVPETGTQPPGGVKTVNQGTAQKFCELTHVVNAYPPQENVNTNIHVYVSEPRSQRALTLPFSVSVLERHQHTTQMFAPMANPTQSPSSGQEGYLVIVALPGEGMRLSLTIDGQPDLLTLRAYWAELNQGISYHPGIWHHPLVATGSTPTTFICVVNECASQPKLDLDEVHYT